MVKVSFLNFFINHFKFSIFALYIKINNSITMKQKWISEINDCLYSQKDNKTQTEQQSVQKQLKWQNELKLDL